MDPAKADPRVRHRLRGARRILVKLGTQVVTGRDGRFALARVTSLLDELAALHADGRQVLMVSSGAVGLGAQALGLARPTSLGLRQACAAVGQGELVALYGRAFAQLGVRSAQVLLTAADLEDADRALCLRTTLSRLLELGVVPILNENDSVSVREITEFRRTDGDGVRTAFGDNDGLSARLAAAMDCDLLVLLTDVDGLYTSNPRSDPTARRVPLVETITPEVFALASGRSTMGTGGMASKLAAAKAATEAGVDVLVADGTAHHALTRALSGKDVGTVLLTSVPPTGRRRRLLLDADVRGALVVNEGALAALRERKASLLPVGVEAVEGHFGEGDLVEIRDGAGVVVARGLTNYDSEACTRLAGQHSESIDAVLGWKGYDALVTRDNLAIVRA